MVLIVVRWRYGMPFDANGCVSTLMNVDSIKCVNEFVVGVDDRIFSGNEQQKVYLPNVKMYEQNFALLTYWLHHNNKCLDFIVRSEICATLGKCQARICG